MVSGYIVIALLLASGRCFTSWWCMFVVYTGEDIYSHIVAVTDT